jgi:hypothetical protein
VGSKKWEWYSFVIIPLYIFIYQKFSKFPGWIATMSVITIYISILVISLEADYMPIGHPTCSARLEHMRKRLIISINCSRA